MKKTKMICTLGPASSDEHIMEELLKAGMDTARINFSHGSHEEQKEKIRRFKAVRDRLGIPAALLLDTKGPEIRTGDFVGGKALLEEGQAFVLQTDSALGTVESVSISYPRLADHMKCGDRILIDDGKISLIVESIIGNNIRCRVLSGGVVKDKKSVNVPGVKLDMEYLSDKDKRDILLGLAEDVDYIAASFARRAEDILMLRTFLNGNGGTAVKIIAKIENMEGVENIDEILKVSDGIMVARGDMGVEVDFEKLPGIQKDIIKKCCEAGKISITATQMLESMTEEPMPTRAEITDVANAVYDGTSAVMLSGETAAGAYPVETVQVMAKILQQAENDIAGMDMKLHYRLYNKGDVSDAVSHAVCQAAEDLDASAIIAITKSGYTAEKISKYRPETLIIAATPNEKTYHQQSLVRGVRPILTDRSENWEQLKYEAIQKTCRAGSIRKGEQVVISAGLPPQMSGRTNMMLIAQV